MTCFELRDVDPHVALTGVGVMTSRASGPPGVLSGATDPCRQN